MREGQNIITVNKACPDVLLMHLIETFNGKPPEKLEDMQGITVGGAGPFSVKFYGAKLGAKKIEAIKTAFDRAGFKPEGTDGAPSDTLEYKIKKDAGSLERFSNLRSLTPISAP